MSIHLSGDVPPETLVSQIFKSRGIEADPAIMSGDKDVEVIARLSKADCDVADAEIEVERAREALEAAENRRAVARATQSVAAAEFDERRQQRAGELSRAAGQLGLNGQEGERPRSLLKRRAG